MRRFRLSTGFTLVEMLFVATLSIAILGGLYGLLLSATKEEDSNSDRIGLQMDAGRAMEEIVALMKKTGPATFVRGGIPTSTSVYATDLPYIWEDGQAPAPPYDALISTNPAGVHQAQPGEEASGPSHEILFAVPEDDSRDSDDDLDGAGTPDIDLPGINDGYPVDRDPASALFGRIQWSHHKPPADRPWVYAIVLVPVQDGFDTGGTPHLTNELQLRTYAEDPGTGSWAMVAQRTLARDVERIRIETPPGTSGPQVEVRPQGLPPLQTLQSPVLNSFAPVFQLRITLFFRRLDGQGRPLTLTQMGTVNLGSVEVLTP